MAQDIFTGRDLQAFQDSFDPPLTDIDLQRRIGLHRNSARKWKAANSPLPLNYRMALAALREGLTPVQRKSAPAPKAKPKRR